MSELAEALRTARQAAGVSLSAMAHRTNYSKALLGHLETGKRTILPEHVQAYEDTLGVPLGTDPIRRAHQWLVDPSPVAVQSRSGRRVGESLADAVEVRVVELRHLDDTVGSTELLPAVTRELTELESLVRNASYFESTGVRLLTATGELSQLAGWVASDAGRLADAQRMYLSGASAAQTAGNNPLVAQLFSTLSYQISNNGNPAEALLLARSAVKGATGATPVVEALLSERAAWASAKAGDRESARRALDAVDDAYERRSPNIPEPEWVYWLNRAEIDVMAGRVLIELREPDKAEPLLAGVVADYPEEHSREVALYLTWLAESYARTGDLDAARQTLGRVHDYATRMPSARTDQRLRVVEGLV